ncbi:unnamed protein product [Vitrella brassicaformis CCMP3155]|uniref:Uncharacterized protein n=1 Tax=Vitrella brassicaformis (strain CCMP3155) TaxID=1169540 RepID=A0A0G4H0F7_VITBC|nr:unnamed protein product [Vitrella brassicaformis CCMP3155]|eukprot:CEM37022.1 unnamed protein product [Vitrella brassicaformis CCMP3155]
MLDAFDEQLTIIKRARVEYGWCVDTPDYHESIAASLDALEATETNQYSLTAPPAQQLPPSTAGSPPHDRRDVR